MKLNEPPDTSTLKLAYKGKHYKTFCCGVHHYILTDRGEWFKVEAHELYKDHL